MIGVTGVTDPSALTGTPPVRGDAHAISTTPPDLPLRRGGVLRGGVQTSSVALRHLPLTQGESPVGGGGL